MNVLTIFLFWFLAGEVSALIESRLQSRDQNFRLLPRGRKDKAKAAARAAKQGGASGSKEKGDTPGSKEQGGAGLSTGAVSISKSSGSARLGKAGTSALQGSGKSTPDNGSKVSQLSGAMSRMELDGASGSRKASGLTSKQSDLPRVIQQATKDPPLSRKALSMKELIATSSDSSSEDESTRPPSPNRGGSSSSSMVPQKHLQLGSTGRRSDTAMAIASRRRQQASDVPARADKKAKAKAVVVGPGQLEAHDGTQTKIENIPAGKAGKWPSLRTDGHIVVGGSTIGGHARATARGDGVRVKIQTGKNGGGFYHDRRRKFAKDGRVVLGPDELVDEKFYGTDEQMAKIRVGVDDLGSAHVMGMKIPKGESKEAHMKKFEWE